MVAELWWAEGQIPYRADHLLPMPYTTLAIVLGDPFTTESPVATGTARLRIKPGCTKPQAMIDRRYEK